MFLLIKSNRHDRQQKNQDVDLPAKDGDFLLRGYAAQHDCGELPLVRRRAGPPLRWPHQHPDHGELWLGRVFSASAGHRRPVAGSTPLLVRAFDTAPFFLKRHFVEAWSLS